jgi:hypothetical protein
LILGPGAAISSIIHFKGVIPAIGKRNTSERLDEDEKRYFNGSAILVRYERKKASGKAFFTPKAHAKLMLQNMGRMFK